MPCEKPTRHSLALEATTQQEMVRSDKVHVVGVTLARALLRSPFSNVRLFRYITETHELSCSVPGEVFSEMRAKVEQSHSSGRAIVAWFRWQENELNT